MGKRIENNLLEYSTAKGCLVRSWRRPKRTARMWLLWTGLVFCCTAVNTYRAKKKKRRKK